MPALGCSHVKLGQPKINAVRYSKLIRNYSLGFGLVQLSDYYLIHFSEKVTIYQWPLLLRLRNCACMHVGDVGDLL